MCKNTPKKAYCWILVLTDQSVSVLVRLDRKLLVLYHVSHYFIYSFS